MSRLLDINAFFPADYEDDLCALVEQEFVSLKISAYSLESEGESNDISVIHFYFKDEMEKNEAEESIRRIFNKLGIESELKSETLDEESYLFAYREFLRPQLIDDKLWIIPFTPGGPDDISQDDGLPRVYIDAQYSFGTGAHPTTRMALKQLIAHAGENPGEAAEGVSVLDLGSGSGILSLAAMRFGYKEITSADIHDKADACLSDNAKINNLPCPKTIIGSISDIDSPSKFELIIMNIETQIIMQLFDKVFTRLENGGTLILSGILRERLDEMHALLDNYKLSKSRQMEEGDWASICIKKV